MILEKEQINRYLRHILIPEISGPGQKKLLNLSVFICGESVSDIASAIYYLAAAGVGHIGYLLADYSGSDELASNIHDLNQDVTLGAADNSNADLRIFLGRPEFIIKKQGLLAVNFVPSVIVLYSGWHGGLQIIKDSDCLQHFLAQLAEVPEIEGSQEPDNTGEVFANCVCGALCVVEAIKLALEIGEAADGFLAFDLLAMEFSKFANTDIKNALHQLGAQKLPTCQATGLEDKKVLIVGTGGLGSPAAYALALAGVGTIGLVDYDTVEISNLNRQILHAVSRLGMPKVESAAIFLKNVKPSLTLNRYNTSLSKENVAEIIDGYDIVIDAVDNFPTRFLLTDACFFANKPMIDAGVIRFDGTARTILPQEGPCYRCTLPTIPASGNVPSCSETGVLGPVPGIMGFIQAAEAVKYLLHQGRLLTDRMLYFDGLFADFISIKLCKNGECPLCGVNSTIRELQEYEFRCLDEVEDK